MKETKQSISECSKLTQQEYKTRYEWVGKVMHWELCKKLNRTTKWYVHKPETILENEMRKILWDFEIQTGHLIPARGSDPIITNERNAYFFVLLLTWIFENPHQKMSKILKFEKKRYKKQILCMYCNYQVESRWCNHTLVLILFQLGRILVVILSSTAS